MRSYATLFSIYNVALDLEDVIVTLFQCIDDYEAAFIEFDYPLPWVIILAIYK